MENHGERYRPGSRRPQTGNGPEYREAGLPEYRAHGSLPRACRRAGSCESTNERINERRPFVRYSIDQGSLGLAPRSDTLARAKAANNGAATTCDFRVSFRFVPFRSASFRSVPDGSGRCRFGPAGSEATASGPGLAGAGGPVRPAGRRPGRRGVRGSCPAFGIGPPQRRFLRRRIARIPAPAVRNVMLHGSGMTELIQPSRCDTRVAYHE